MDKLRLPNTSLGIIIIFILFLLQFSLALHLDSRFHPISRSKTNITENTSTENGFVPSSRYLPSLYEYLPSSPSIPTSTFQFNPLYHSVYPQSSFQSNPNYFLQNHHQIMYSPQQIPTAYFPSQYAIPGPTLKSYPPSNPYFFGHNFGTPPPTYTRHLQLPHYYQHFQHPPPPFPKYEDGFDVGTLPQQVRVPGNIRVDIIGKDAEIICEFPKYLILIQGIYWHHKYNDPFGSYFDSQNGFGTHTTVRSEDQWKSVLVIRDFNADDFGFYRCLSAAALPVQLGSEIKSPPPVAYDYHPTIIPAFVPSPPPFKIDSIESDYPTMQSEVQTSNSIIDEKKQRISRYLKNTRKMRFPTPDMTTRKSRKIREIRKDNQIDNKTPQATSYVHNRRFYNNHYPDTASNYLNDYTYKRLTNPYVEEAMSNSPFQSNNAQQNERHFPFSHSHHIHAGISLGIPPITTYPPTTFPTTTATTAGFGHGLQVPYYKPSFTYYTIYQEVKFEPRGVDAKQAIIMNH